MVDNAVRKELEPLRTEITSTKNAVETVKTETQAQTSKLVSINNWKDELWGNGKGTPGYLGRARAEDKARLDRIEAQGDRMEKQNSDMVNSVDALKKRVATDDAVKAAVTEAVDAITTRRQKWTKTLIEILSVLAAAGGLNWLTHLLHLTGK